MGEDQGWVHSRQHLVVEGRVRCGCIWSSWCISATGAYFCKARPKDQTREGPRTERNPFLGTTSFFYAAFPFASPPSPHLGFIFGFLLRSFPFFLFILPHIFYFSFSLCLFLHSLSSCLSMVLYAPLFPLFWSAVSFFQTKYSSLALHSHRNGLRRPEVAVLPWQHLGLGSQREHRLGDAGSFKA